MIRSWCFLGRLPPQWTVGSRGEMESGVDWRRMAGPGAQDVSRSNSLDPHFLSSPFLGAGVDNPSPPAPPLGAGQRYLLCMLERRGRGPATFRALFLTQSPSPHPLQNNLWINTRYGGHARPSVTSSVAVRAPPHHSPDKRTDLWQQGLFLLGGAAHVHISSVSSARM